MSAAVDTFLGISFPMEPWRPFGPDGLELAPFGFLVAIGIILGTVIAGRRAKQLGLSERVVADVALWAVIPGFIGAHLVHQLAYYPHELVDHYVNGVLVPGEPWRILMIWKGISSFGGFIGGTLGVVYYFRKHKELPFLPYADAIIFGFAFAWIFGRLGCTTAFDHPGSPTDFFMGMTYGGDQLDRFKVALHGKVIHNLGLYEALWSVGMSAFFWSQRNKPRFKGWYLAAFVIAYMPFRFMLDFLREVDVRYGLTPGQWFAILLLGLGIHLALKASKKNDVMVPDGIPKTQWWPAGEVACRKHSSVGN
jgi:phosphatidylglycerol:prolipoprotein diacylglycerol transferase